MKKIILAFLLLALLLPAVGCAAQEEKERVTVVAHHISHLSVCAGGDRWDGGGSGRAAGHRKRQLPPRLHPVHGGHEKAGESRPDCPERGGLEDFLSDALATSDAEVVDCSAGAELLETADCP